VGDAFVLLLLRLRLFFLLLRLTLLFLLLFPLKKGSCAKIHGTFAEMLGSFTEKQGSFPEIQGSCVPLWRLILCHSTAYFIWSVKSSVSSLNQRFSSLGLFCQVLRICRQRVWFERGSSEGAEKTDGCMLMFVDMRSCVPTRSKYPSTQIMLFTNETDILLFHLRLFPPAGANFLSKKMYKSHVFLSEKIFLITI